jgi:hypothetical protein
VTRYLLLLAALAAFFTPVEAADVRFFLTIVAMKALNAVPPKVLAGFSEYDDCAAAAQKLNATDDDLKDEDMKALGARYVCMKLLGDA